MSICSRNWSAISRRVLVSDMAGKSNIAYKAKALGIDLDKKNALGKVVHQVKLMEDKGYQFDAADGSFPS